MHLEKIEIQERLTPRFELREGEDFFCIEELHAKVISKLADLDILDEELLLCGYDASVDSTGRRTTFASTVREMSMLLHRPSSDLNIPYEYAFEAVALGGVPEVAVYDPKKFVEIGIDEYALLNGHSLNDAEVMKIRIIPA